MASQLQEQVNFLEQTFNRYILNQDKAMYLMTKDTANLKADTKALKIEMKGFKDEMKAFKDEMKEFKDEMQDFKDEMKDFKDEMKDFKDEMQDFKDEMKEFKDEMKEFKDEMKEFKDEMKVFKNEMQVFKEESVANRITREKELEEFKVEMRAYREKSKAELLESRRQWGHLTNKLGTFGEALAVPNIPRIAKEYFGQEKILRESVRVLTTLPNDPDKLVEFDAIIETEGAVFLLENKFTVRMKDIQKLPELIENFQLCYPEYETKALHVIFGSMSIPQNITKHLTKMNIYALELGAYNMDLINFEQIQDKKK